MQNNRSRWAHLEKATTVTVEFYERKAEDSPYSMEIKWEIGETGQERFTAVDCHAHYKTTQPTALKYLPRLREAATEARSVQTLLIQYHHDYDRTWPYATLPMILEAFSLEGMHPTVELENPETPEREFKVTFDSTAPKTNKKKRARRAPFTDNVDMTHVKEPIMVYEIQRLLQRKMDGI